MANSRICKIDGCNKPTNARGWCRGHYVRWLRYGDPLSGSTPRGSSAGSPQKFLAKAILYKGNKCLKWPFNTVRGYGQIRIGGKLQIVSRVVCIEVNGPPPTGDYEAAHSCGNGSFGCCTPSHLSWKTRVGNQQDRIEHGTSNRGEQHGMSKLTLETVNEIIRLRGVTAQRDLADRFGVAVSTISQIQNRKSWVWIPENEGHPTCR